MGANCCREKEQEDQHFSEPASTLATSVTDDKSHRTVDTSGELRNKDIQRDAASLASAIETILSIPKRGADEFVDTLLAHIAFLISRAMASIEHPSSPSQNNMDPDGTNPAFGNPPEVEKARNDLWQLEKSVCGVGGIVVDGRDTFNNAATTVLENIRKSHWPAACLIIVAFMLERFESLEISTTTTSDFLPLVTGMYKITEYIHKMSHQSLKFQLGFADLIEDSLKIVAEATFLLSSLSLGSGPSMFLAASVKAERLKGIQHDLEEMHRNFMFTAITSGHEREEREQFFPKHAVGLEARLREIVELLEYDSKKRVAAVVLYGVAGVGKTTLADAVYSSFQIDGWGFSRVALFTDISCNPDTKRVQKDILDQLSQTSAAEYKKSMSSRQCQALLLQCFQERPCLLLIDNVMNGSELRKMLPQNLDRCSKLRLLITTRNEVVANSLDIEHPEDVKLYHVEPLPYTEAMAFLTSQMGKSLEKKDMDFLLRISAGIPLFIELVGRYIRYEGDRSRAMKFITEVYDRRESSSNHLFDFAVNALPKLHRDLLLDICTFFAASELAWNAAENIFSEEAILLLKNRGLIRKRSLSRSSISNDSTDLNIIKLQVEGVILEEAQRMLGTDTTRIRSTGQLESQLFAKGLVQNVRGIIPQDEMEMKDEKDNAAFKIDARVLDMISSSLRIFSTTAYPGGHVAAIEIQGQCQALFQKLLFWNSPHAEPPFAIDKAPELRFLSYCTAKPVNLSQMARSLRTLCLGLQKLSDDETAPIIFPAVSDSVLPDLHTFEIVNSTGMVRLPTGTLPALHSLEWLKIQNFSRLEELPDDLHELPNLTKLQIINCPRIERLPENLEQCLCLSYLELDGCEMLRELPGTVGCLSLLEDLSLRGCKKLIRLSINFGRMTSLRTLLLNGCQSLLHLDHSFQSLTRLEILDLSNCHKLDAKCIDQLLPIKSLRTVYLVGSSQLKDKATGLARGVTKIRFYV